MGLQRAYARQLAFTLFDSESTYGAAPAGWTSADAASMMDYEGDSGIVSWEGDLIVPNNDLLTGFEMVTHHELVRQSSTITYVEPRTKPNTIAGLMGLTIGAVASTQDGVETAYRHRITKATSLGQPSIAAMAKMEGGDQREYRGLKGSSNTLSFNGAFLQLSSELIGSGYRAASATAFPAAIAENWLRMGDCRLYFKDTGTFATGFTPITDPTTPVQGAANLGGSEVNISTRVRTFSFTWQNALAAEAGYRASTGMLRANFHPIRRNATMTIQIDSTTETEATDLAYYLDQHRVAFELNCDSGILIDAGGTYKYGMILVIPAVHFQSIARSQVEELEVITFEGNVIDDQSNSAVIIYSYNAQPAYLT